MKRFIVVLIIVIILTLTASCFVTSNIKHKNAGDYIDYIPVDNTAISDADVTDVTEEHRFTVDDLSSYQKSIIAHGGGALDGNTYTSCYDAVKNSYSNGIRLMELDVEYTTDGKPVMLHSWDGFQFKYLGLDRNTIYSYDEFNNATMINGWTQLNLDSTFNYMKSEFPEMFFITDTKNDNTKLLTTIANDYTDMMDMVIPQIYNQEEYHLARSLGFKNIIYTLYMSTDTDDEVVEFCKNNDLFAITMPQYRAENTDLPARLNEIGVYVYTHTINDQAIFDSLKEKGVKGIYTDDLI